MSILQLVGLLIAIIVCAYAAWKHMVILAIASLIVSLAILFKSVRDLSRRRHPPLRILTPLSEREGNIYSSIIQQNELDLELEKLQIIIEIDRFVTDCRKTGKTLSDIIRTPELMKCVEKFTDLMDMSSGKQEMTLITLKYENLAALAELIQYCAR